MDDTDPLNPKKLALLGSMKFTLIIRPAFGNPNPRSITPLTTLESKRGGRTIA